MGAKRRGVKRKARRRPQFLAFPMLAQDTPTQRWDLQAGTAELATEAAKAVGRCIRNQTDVLAQQTG
jgi:hypothetical protein